MSVRQVVGAAFAASFVLTVAAVSVATQCPARELGACARIHLEVMRPRSAAPLRIVAPPMRGTSERG